MKRSPAFHNMSSLRKRMKQEKLQQLHESSENEIGLEEDLSVSTNEQSMKEPFSLEPPLEFVDSTNLGPDISNLCEEWESKEQARSGFQASFDRETSSESGASAYTDRSEDEYPRQTGDLKKSLRSWAIKHQISSEALTALLKILRKHECFGALPSDAAGLLGSDNVTRSDFNSLANLVKQQGQQIAQLNTSVRRLASSVSRQHNSRSVQQLDPFHNEDLLKSLMPIKTMEDLDYMENLLSDEDKVDTLATLLGRIGGNDAGKTVRRIMREILVDDVGVHYSWLGRKGKKVWAGFKLNNVILRATRINFPKATKQEVENCIKDWLRQSQCRLDLSSKKRSSMLNSSNS